MGPRVGTQHKPRCGKAVRRVGARQDFSFETPSGCCGHLRCSKPKSVLLSQQRSTLAAEKKPHWYVPGMYICAASCIPSILSRSCPSRNASSYDLGYHHVCWLLHGRFNRHLKRPFPTTFCNNIDRPKLGDVAYSCGYRRSDRGRLQSPYIGGQRSYRIIR